MVRIVALMALRPHLIANWRFADYATGEVTLANELWRELPDHSLTIADRGFLVANELCAIENGSNRHWLTRAKKTTKLRQIEKLGPNDHLVEIELSAQTRRRAPNVPSEWKVRAVKYQRIAYPAAEVIALYHERWEIEIGYDEIKTHLLEREESIRSKTPAACGRSCGASASRTTSSGSKWSGLPMRPASLRLESVSSTHSH
jgi:hypothetical protein